MDFKVQVNIQYEVKLYTEMITLIFSIRITFACMDCPLEVHDYNVVN